MIASVCILHALTNNGEPMIKRSVKAIVPTHTVLEGGGFKVRRPVAMGSLMSPFLLLDEMGPVNLRAEIEMKELEQQISNILLESEDLQNAIDKLRLSIKTLNREGKERILVSFEKVQVQFQKIFKQLFSGGEAKLEFTDPSDPLNSGLEIMAKPPGKKLQTLSLLSGGEKALTAISLLFAVFLTNPSPLCVLDEVDAPLDDTNVARFCDLLDEIIICLPSSIKLLNV